MDFLQSKNITLRRRIKCLEEQVRIFSFIVQEIKCFALKFLTKLSDGIFFFVFIAGCVKLLSVQMHQKCIYVLILLSIK